jgi:hypothetical protein
MPLPLDDPRWQTTLCSSYGDCDNVVRLLKRAYEAPLTSEELGELVNEVNHQGDPSEAALATVPHLVNLAATSQAELAREYLIHAGLMLATAGLPKAPPCPDFLMDDISECKEVGVRRLAEFFPSAQDETDFRSVTAAMAGFLGHHALAHLLDGLDCYGTCPSCGEEFLVMETDLNPFWNPEE